MPKDLGQGQTEPKTRVATTGKPTQPLPGERTDGEWPGAGSIHTATLNERQNKSNMRNRGPSRGTGGLVGDAVLPILTSATRRTGRTG